MAVRKETGKKPTKSLDAKPEVSSKSKKKANLDEDDDALENLDDEETKPAGKAKAGAKAAKKSKLDEDDDEEDDAEDPKDEWENSEEEDTWDPDFEEFDIPKSKVKKPGSKNGEDEEDDNFKLNQDLDEFDDLFSGGKGGFDDDDDF